MIFRLAAAALVLAAAACASYEPSSKLLPAAMESRHSASEGGYRVDVDPYAEPERQKALFDADFGKAGMMAIRILVANRTPKPVLVRRSDVLLALSGGRRIGAVSGHSAATRVGESGSVFGAYLAFGLIGALAASNAEDTARSARVTDYESKAFKDATLGPDRESGGFLYFALPAGTGPVDEAHLEVRFVDLDAATSRLVSVPMTGLGFTGAPADGTVSDECAREREVDPTANC